MLTNLKTILDVAYANKYAVGSFNGYNSETFRGIIEAGKETKTPIILAFGAKYLTNFSLESAAALTKSLAEDLDIPVCLHLDHCSDMDVVFRAIKAGFGSVMYDGSMLPYEQNLANTKKVCDVAHACGVSVEAELGSLAAGDKSHEGSADDKEVYSCAVEHGKTIEDIPAVPYKEYYDGKWLFDFDTVILQDTLIYCEYVVSVDVAEAVENLYMDYTVKYKDPNTNEEYSVFRSHKALQRT